MRYGLRIQDVTAAVGRAVPVFRQAVEKECDNDDEGVSEGGGWACRRGMGCVKAINFKQLSRHISKKEIKALQKEAQQAGAEHGKPRTQT